MGQSGLKHLSPAKWANTFPLAAAPPWVEVGQARKVVVSGESATLECKAGGVPAPSITWLKGHQVVSRGVGMLRACLFFVNGNYNSNEKPVLIATWKPARRTPNQSEITNSISSNQSLVTFRLTAFHSVDFLDAKSISFRP